MPTTFKSKPASREVCASSYDTLSSIEARDALDSYESWCKDQQGFDPSFTVERGDFGDHARRVTRILYTYCDELISDSVYDVALLHDVVDRVQDTKKPAEQRTRAAHATAEYLTRGEHSAEFWQYQAGVMGDLSVIEDAAEEYRRQLGREKNIDSTQRDVLINSYQGEIDADTWSIKEPVIDISHLHDVATKVNIEAIMIKAAEAIDILMHPGPRPASLLQDCIEAETFYAPMCEVLGLDAMAAKLRSEAAKRRLEGQGQYDLINQAKAINEAADYFKAQSMFSDIFRTDQIKLHDSHGRMLFGEESMHFGSGEIGGCLEGSRVTYRIKSIGSLASKLQRDGIENMPLDIFGMTVVVDDESRLGDVFANTIKTLSENPNITFEAAPSKQSPVYIQGTEEYVREARSALSAAGIEDFEEKIVSDAPDAYRVCKFTTLVANNKDQVLPMEVQFLTTHDRKNARIGATAHIVYKQQKLSNNDVDVDDLVSFLEEIYERKNHIDKSTGNINKYSIERGDKLIRLVSETL